MFSYSTNSLHLLTHNTNKKSVIVLITLFLLQFFSFSMNISQKKILEDKNIFIQYYNKHFSILVHI
jgi:hypothetical protein